MYVRCDNPETRRLGVKYQEKIAAEMPPEEELNAMPPEERKKAERAARSRAPMHNAHFDPVYPDGANPEEAEPTHGIARVEKRLGEELIERFDAVTLEKDERPGSTTDAGSDENEDETTNEEVS